MIDLHMHTKYSDGTYSVKDILNNANRINLETISITDHNTCNAYDEMESFDVSKIFKGNILVGCEFTTSFDKRLIEVLGYGFNYKKINEYLNKFYNKDLVDESTNIIYKRLLSKINDLDLTSNVNNIRKKKFKNEFLEREIYEELVKYTENMEKIKEDIWNTFSDFYRKGLTNPQSKIFINRGEFKPPLKEIINIVHENGGMFLYNLF